MELKLSDLSALLLGKRRPDFYISLCCIIKDENAYLSEWLSYHLKIGVQHFFLYDNGSKTPIATTVQQLGLSRYVSFVDFPGDSKQNNAYAHCLKKFGHRSAWIGFIDMDEFIVPKSTRGDLPLYLKSFEDFGGLGVNWLVFGSGGHVKKSGQSQLTTFVWRSDISWHVNTHIKSIVQPKYVKGVRNAHYFKYKRGKFCVNEKFKKISDSFSDVSVDDIQLNHYFCRSLEEYEEKIIRGRADVVSATRSKELFFEFDNISNKVNDTSILNLEFAKNDITAGAEPPSNNPSNA